MKRITVTVNDEWLDAASEQLGTSTKVSTINAALHFFALERESRQIVDAFDQVSVDCEGASDSWRYGGGRDLSRLVENARQGQ
jgi:hypothetical protein